MRLPRAYDAGRNGKFDRLLGLRYGQFWMKETRQTPRGRGKAPKLDAEEEKVLRMSRGLGGKDDLELEMRGKNDPEVWAKLREIENRAFQQSGRIAAMKKRAADEEAAEEGAGVKAKIVDRLSAKADAKVQASVKSGAKAKKKKSD